MSTGTQLITYLFPLFIIGGIAAYYFLVYRKGKAAGGGLVEGFAIAEREKWSPVLPPNERVLLTGMAFLHRPGWQVFLASQIPALRLVWPTVSFQLVLTDQGRLGVAKYTMLGGLKDHKAYGPGGFRLESAIEQKQGLAMKLNPLAQLYPAGPTYDVTLGLADGPLHLVSLQDAFVRALGASAPMTASAAA